MFRVEYAFMRVGIMVECSHVTLGSRLMLTCGTT